MAPPSFSLTLEHSKAMLLWFQTLNDPYKTDNYHRIIDAFMLDINRQRAGSQLITHVAL
ncbi:MAG: hypothetical protein M1835_000513, partial [Candelina submexicana]